ncbi:MAG: protein phosphatase 2C domain-containing protein [Bacteroidales bacterium]|nr:protein phosphatase 2C domain-containing protein [Bacteroidales bacterium]
METAKTKELTNFHYISLTDVGARRSNNEDSAGYFDTPNGHVFVVCDGCGGMPCGERASQAVVSSMKFFFTNFYYKDPYAAIKDAISYAHNRLIEEGQKNYECSGMATTLVLVLIRYNKAYYGHVGDSRIYYYSHRQLSQITHDDSYVQHLVDTGKISAMEAETHPRKNELLQVMGQLEKEPEPHICERPIDPNEDDMLLLCTDGLFNMVSSNDICATLSRRGYIEDKGMDLIKNAIANGGFDNVTLQIIKFFNVDIHTDKTEQTPIYNDYDTSKGHTPLAIAIIAIVLSVLGVLFYLKETKKQESRAAANTAHGEYITYDITQSTNIDSILQVFGIPKSKAIFADNNGQQTMQIPVRKVMTARYYDTPTLLEQLYGVPRERIIKVNNLKNQNTEPGREIIIP